MAVADYVAFLTACIVLALVPGPDMVFILGRSIAQGRRAGILSAIGINLGAYLHMLASVFGLSVILATSSTAFSVLKWLGAAYLFYLGVGALLRRGAATLSLNQDNAHRVDDRSLLIQGFMTDALNPKVAVFFLAFLPQFVDADSEWRVQSFLILGITVNVLCLAVNLVLVYLATAATHKFRIVDPLSSWLEKGLGLIFIGLAIRLARESAAQ